MRTTLFTLLLILAFNAVPEILFAQQTQHDSPETLDWVQRRANHIDTMLYGAVISQEPVNLLLKLWGSWQEFDAVAQAGVYCQAARTAAEKGRKECDLLGYERDQDVNAMIARATEARRQAYRMRMAAQACAADTAALIAASPSFTPVDIVVTDAQIVEQDLTDAQAVQDMHIVVQKLEHAQRILRDIELLTWSMNNCNDLLLSTRTARQHCRDASTSTTWEEAAPYVEKALEEVRLIKDKAVNCH